MKRGPIRRTVLDVLRVYARQWWRLVLVQLLAGIAVAVIVYALFQLTRLAITALRPALTGGDGALNLAGAILLALGVVLAFAATGVPLLLSSVVATVSISDDALSGRRTALFPALGLGILLGYRMLGAVLLAFGTVALLLVLSPVLTVVGVLGLLATVVVRLVRRRRPEFAHRWPSIATLVWCAIPFAVALRRLARALLTIPAVVLESLGPIAASRAAGSAVQSRRLLTLLGVLVAIVVGLLVNAGSALLASLLGPVPQLVVQSVVQLAALGIPIVTVTVLYRLAADERGHRLTPEPLPGHRRAERLAPMPWPAWIRRTATAMPAVLLIAGVSFGPAAAADATPAPGVTYTVTSSADHVDAPTLSAEQASCVSGAGDCTLRAALAQAATTATAGGTTAITIAFASDMTIAVDPSGPLAFSMTHQGGDGPEGEGGEGGSGEGGGEGAGTAGTLTIDGLGHDVTIDGQGAVQDLSLFSPSWNFAVRGLELRGGHPQPASGNAGGGLSINAPRTSTVDTVTFDHNTAMAGAGLYAGANTDVLVTNSTFANNTLLPADAETFGGGADVFGGGATTIRNTTLVRSTGGSVFLWGTLGATLELDDSLIADTYASSQGGFACVSYGGGAMNGAGNVSIADSGSCPGVVGTSDPAYVGDLTRVADGYPPVVPLRAVNGNTAIRADTTDCLPTDARGATRPTTGCDAGAYQFDPATLVTLSSSANPASYGDALTLTAHVGAPGEPTGPTSGTVQFIVDGAAFGAPVAVDGQGDAALTTSALAAATHTVTASYAPASGGVFAAGGTGSSLAQVVVQAGTPVSLRASATSVALGDDVTLTIGLGDGGHTLTGTVDVADVTDGTPGTVVASGLPVADNAATVTTHALAPGARTLVAHYSGDAGNAAGDSNALVVDVLAPSRTMLVVDPITAAYGAPITATAHVAGDHGAATGQVVFTRGGQTLGVVAVDASGTATVSSSVLAVGTTPIVARYQGDTLYARSDSGGVDLHVLTAATVTTLAASATSAGYGVPVTLTATVRDTASGSTADPAGTVAFSVDGTTIGSATVAGHGDGTATASLTTAVGDLPVGSRAIVATFTDADGSFGTSASNATAVQVGAAATSATAATDGTPAPYGHLVQLTATVAATGGSTAVPTGTARFTDGTTVLGTVPLVAGAATLGVGSLAVGSHTIAVDYLGSDSFAPSATTLTQVVSTAATTTTLTPSTTGPVYGQGVDLDIVVAGAGGDAPDGSVVVRDGDGELRTVTVTTGAARVTGLDLAVGIHHLSAQFVADGSHLASTGTADVTVAPAPTTTTETLSRAHIQYGESVTISATVRNTANTVTPAGSVQFLAGGVVLATVPGVDDGHGTLTAEYTTTALAQSGGWSAGLPLQSVFVPADGFATSSDQTGRIVVDPVATRLQLTGTSATTTNAFSATATVTSDYGAVPTGAVLFSDDEGVLGVVPLTNGVATMPGLHHALGTDTITAVYSTSDPNFLVGVPAGSDRATARFDVTAGGPDVVLSDTATDPFLFGSADTLTAIVGANTADIAPTGQVVFTADGPGFTSTVLGTVTVEPWFSTDYSRAVRAQLTTTAIPLGAQRITATYQGDDRFLGAASNVLTRTVLAATTTTTVSVGQEPGWVGAPVTYVVDVQASNGAFPAGTVNVTRDGIPVGSATVAFGRAVVIGPAIALGTSTVVASFVPGDGFGGSSDTLQHVTTLLPTTVSIVGDHSFAGIGETVRYTATVRPPAGYTTATSQAPSGVVHIGDGAGADCAANLGAPDAQGAATASCTLTFAHAGTPQIAAAYEGVDGLYAAATSSAVALPVNRTAPTIAFDTTGAWTGGETATLTWRISGPTADDATVTIRSGSTVVCSSQARVGSCDYTFPTRLDADTTLRLSYAGDADWLPATQELTAHVTACVPAGPVTASPAAGGTVTRITQPDCDGGTGFRSGDSVLFVATPAHGYSLGAWMFGTTASGLNTVVVNAAMASVTNTAYFNADCVSVSLTSTDASARISATQPNCGSDWHYQGRNVVTQTALFRPGTVLHVVAVPATVAAGAPQQSFHQWSGLPAGATPTAATQDVTVQAGTDLDLTASFGVLCYHDVGALPGVTMDGPNCTDPAGPGYADRSTVNVGTKTTGTGYFTGWTGTGSVRISDVTSTTTSSTAKALISGDHSRIGASYGTCYSAPLAVQGEGTATATPTGNCPSQGAGWYTAGSYVTLHASPERGRTFAGWTGTTLTATGAKYPDGTTQVNADGPITATFYYGLHCAPLNFVSVPAGAVSLSAAFPVGVGTCPAGMYDVTLTPNANVPVDFTATPLSAAAKNAVIGIAVDTQRVSADSLSHPVSYQATRGATRSADIMGATTVTATVCESLDAQLTLISPNGTRHTTPNPGEADFINVAPTPTCPFGVGYVPDPRPIFPQANAPADGYTFVSWSGALTSTEAYATTGFVLNGAEASKTLTATYQVVCHRLTSNFANVRVLPAPNCPDTDPSQNMYIGGTAVTLQATGDGDDLFRGWTGHPDSTSDDIAIALMKSDQAVYADYTAETVGEKISGAFTTVGDALAVTAKKVTGVVAAVGSALILGANPVTAIAGIVVGIGSLVTMGLSALGVSGAGLDGVKDVLSDVSSMMTFITATLNCATAWSYSADGTGSSSPTGTGVSGAAGAAISKEINVQMQARAAAQQAAINEAYGVSTASSALGSAKVTVGRLGSAATIGMAIYTQATAGGGGWDSSATSAWTTGGDLYSRCVGQSIPAYFGLPPVAPPQ